LYDVELEVDKFDVWKYPKSWELSFPSLPEAGFQIECHWWEGTMGWDGRAPLSGESI
jgi:hypothetical protein